MKIGNKERTRVGPNRSTKDVIDTETGIYTSPKFDLYFRFHLPLSIKTALLNFSFYTEYGADTLTNAMTGAENNCLNRNAHLLNRISTSGLLSSEQTSRRIEYIILE